MTTILAYVPADEHTLEGHPENAGRIAAIKRLLEQEAALSAVDIVEAVPASTEQLLRVHSPSLIQSVQLASSQGGGNLDPDTYCTKASFDQARLAVGTTCLASELIMQGEVDNGIVLVRPPGHHAERSRVGGFCLFNNVAIAARHVQQLHGSARVLILDYDVHHGNGTQAIFYEDPTVLYISLHMFGPFFYPGTGSAREIGRGEGLGATLNIPFGSRAGDEAYALMFRDLLEPVIAIFGPDMILVSAGFDAHWQDPLAAAAVTLTGYAQMSRQLIELAGLNCQGKVLFVLEGGYHFQALANGVLNVIYALTGKDLVRDPLGPAPYTSPDVTNLLLQLQRLHLPS
ncbi:MAG TPA: histone deacetylase [Anaerolineae bacterium]|nr:histone deacetylase [Anaerolineae bacterium]